MSFDKSEYLKGVLDTHKMSHVEDLIITYQEKREIIKEALKEHYGSSLYTQINSGSYAKHTAINTKFDLDLIVPFKKERFNSLSEMYNDLLDFFKNTYSDDDLKDIKEQRVSIGLTFTADFEDLNIDIVPGRELSDDDYTTSKKLNLHINDNLGQSILTNIHAQIEHIKGRKNARECIRLLKIWKAQHEKAYLKSFFLELITVRAFKENEDNLGKLYNNLEMVIQYITEHIELDSFRLIDPGNSNNNLTDTLSADEKGLLRKDLENLLEKVEASPENLKLYFKENPLFSSKEYSVYKRTKGGAAILGTTSFG